MKFFLSFFLITLTVFSGCSTPEIPADDEIDTSLPDLTNLYAQVCESSSGPCIPMACQLEADTYTCAESISDRTKECSSVKTLDDVFSKYVICGKEKSIVEALQVFSYGATLESVTLADSPDALEQKIEEEKAVVEEGGSSDFLSTLMAAAAGSIIGGLIANAMFGQNNAMPPARPDTVNERPMNKEDLKKAEADTKANNKKLENSKKQTKTQAQKRAQKRADKKRAAEQKKSSTTQKKKSSSKKRRR